MFSEFVWFSSALISLSLLLSWDYAITSILHNIRELYYMFTVGAGFSSAHLKISCLDSVLETILTLSCLGLPFFHFLNCDQFTFAYCLLLAGRSKQGLHWPTHSPKTMAAPHITPGQPARFQPCPQAPTHPRLAWGPCPPAVILWVPKPWPAPKSSWPRTLRPPVPDWGPPPSWVAWGPAWGTRPASRRPYGPPDSTSTPSWALAGAPWTPASCLGLWARGACLFIRGRQVSARH